MVNQDTVHMDYVIVSGETAPQLYNKERIHDTRNKVKWKFNVVY